MKLALAAAVLMSFAGLQPGGPPTGPSPTPTVVSLVVLNKSDNTALTWTLPGEKPGAPIATGAGPHEIAPLPGGERVVVSNYGDTKAGSTLSVLDLSGKTPARLIDLGDYRRPHGLALLPDGKSVLVTAEANEALLQVDLESGKVVRHWPTGQKTSHMVVVTRDGKTAVTANIASGSVTLLDLTKEGPDAATTVRTEAGTEGLALSPDEQELWVANNRADTISVVSLSEKKVVATIPAKSYGLRLAFTPDGARVLMTSTKSGELVEFDAKTRKETRRLSLAPVKPADFDPAPADGDMKGSVMPIGMVLTQNSSRAFIACSAIGAVAEVDLTSWKVLGHRRTGKTPDGIALATR